MEQRQTGGKADENVFFFFFFSFLNGTNVSGMLTRGKKEGAKGWRGGSEPRSLARLSAGEGPERSLQTLVIPLLLM